MQSQQLCLFCTFRNGVLPRTRPNTARAVKRAFTSQPSPLRRPAGAAAQERDDDEEGVVRYQRIIPPPRTPKPSAQPQPTSTRAEPSSLHTGPGRPSGSGPVRYTGIRQEGQYNRDTRPQPNESRRPPLQQATYPSREPRPDPISRYRRTEVQTSGGSPFPAEQRGAKLPSGPPIRFSKSSAASPGLHDLLSAVDQGPTSSRGHSQTKKENSPRVSNSVRTQQSASGGSGAFESVLKSWAPSGQSPNRRSANDSFVAEPPRHGPAPERRSTGLFDRSSGRDAATGNFSMRKTHYGGDSNNARRTSDAGQASWRSRDQLGSDQRSGQSPFNAFDDAVRASGRGRFGDGMRQNDRFSTDQQPRSGQRSVRAPRDIDTMAAPPPELNVTSDDAADYDPERERGRDRERRAARSDRYAIIDDSTPTPSEEQEREERAKARAKARELENIESMMEGDSGRRKKKKKQAERRIAEAPSRPSMEIPEFISVQNMAQALGLRLEAFIEKLEEEGFEDARHDHLLDSGTSSMLAEMYGFEPLLATAEAQEDLVARPPTQDSDLLVPRPPIVTIMGHVDHGKTTILDYLRKANVVASEHGGITQHIGAFSVVMPVTQRTITFLDTPGHAAFLDMRRRGANVTDIVVLVVAADDSVMPQTKEAIKHALDAGVQIIVAINKVDKPDANVQRVKEDLSRENIAVEDFGGDYQAIALSGKTGQGMDDLEEAIITLADVSDFRAETTGAAEGWIIESKVTAAGRVATVLVRRGTLRIGDYIVAGNTWARVRTLRNDVGDMVSEASPGTPVQIDGWRGEDPVAGLEVLQAGDEQHAKDVVTVRLAKTEAMRAATDTVAINTYRAGAAEARAKVLEWQSEQGWTSRKQQRIRLRDTRTGWINSEDKSGPTKVHFVVKADVAGSVEAITAAVSAIGNNEVQANVVHSATGMLSESDIRMLATSGEVCYAISFNQPIDGTIYRLAEAADLEILDYNVIYKLTDAVKEKLSAELAPLIKTKVVGEAEVAQLFEVGKKGNKQRVAGCKITNGLISRAHKVRVLRGDVEVFTGILSSLKNVKRDVSEMRKDSECGMVFDNWENILVGDRVQCFEEISEPRKLY